jgi:hypothetical protein
VPPASRLKSPLALVLHDTHACACAAAATVFRAHGVHACSSAPEAVPATHPS